MGDRTAFFYGTLMVRQILFRVLYSNENADKDPMYSEVISRMTFSPALLRNYLRHRVRHVSYPAVAPAKGKNVQGIFVTGLTDGDIWRLDRFEGDQYVRKMLDVEMLGDEGRFAGGEVKRAEVYVWKSKGKLGLEEKEWSIEEFRRDSLSQWVGEEGNNEYEDLETDYAVVALSDKPGENGGGKASSGGQDVKDKVVDDEDLNAAV